MADSGGGDQGIAFGPRIGNMQPRRPSSDGDVDREDAAVEDRQKVVLKPHVEALRLGRVALGQPGDAQPPEGGSPRQVQE